MIIDYSYFIGKLNLPQRTSEDGQADIARFIQQYELEYLRAALGFDLRKAFLLGLQEDPIPQRWLDLLNGADYTFKGKNDNWPGFAPLSNGSTVSVDTENTYKVTIAAEATSFVLPANFVGVPIAIELRGAGRLEEGTEYTITGNTVTVLNPSSMGAGTVLFLFKGPSINVTVTDTLKLSPIANFVYYRYLENRSSDTTLTGEVVSITDNNRTVNGMIKMIDAWNRMADQNKKLYGFLQANATIYPEWKAPCHCNYRWLWDTYYRCHTCCGDVDNVFRKKNSLDL